MSLTDVNSNGRQTGNVFSRLGFVANDRPSTSADPNNHNTPTKADAAMRQEPLSPTLKMQRSLYDHAKTKAIESAALTPQATDLADLENHARAMARETYRELFDPSQHIHDQMLQTEYDKNCAERTDAEVAEKHALIAVRQREDEMANVHPGDPPKPLSPILPASAVIGLAITVAPTLHDQIFTTIDDQMLAWILSLAGGLFLALLIVLMILDPSDERSVTNKIGLVAGILMGLALGSLRLRDAQNAGDYIFAFGLTLLEVAIVIGVEAVAGRRRSERRGWNEKKSIADKTRGLFEAAHEHLRRAREKVKELNQTITAHHQYVENRVLSNVSVDELEASALGAVRDGYSAGIALNHGLTLRPGSGGIQ